MSNQQNIVYGHRMSGKTSMAIAFLAEGCKKKPNFVGHYVTPFSHNAEAAMVKFRNLVGDNNVSQIRYGEKEIKMLNGSTVKFFSEMDTKLMRGIVLKPDSVVVDDADALDKEKLRLHYLLNAPDAIVWWFITIHGEEPKDDDGQLPLFD